MTDRMIFDSIRDYVNALEASGLAVRFKGVDQDAYEATAIMYRLIDKFGRYAAPAVIFENLKVNGVVHATPVVANLQGHLNSEAMLLGTPVNPQSVTDTYQMATRAMLELLERESGEWPAIPPREIEASGAYCKEVKLSGDEIYITTFPFIQGNPGDSGPYINTASVFTRDAELGVNFGTYRCQIKGPRKIMVNFEKGQTGIKMMDAAKARGETSIPVALVIGQDPMTWMISSSRVPSRFRTRGPIDELAIAGGLRGKAIDVVRTQDGNFLVPANAEIVIEGTVDIFNREPEGPYHEMFGYMGIRKEKNFVMTLDTVTHRKLPWVMNSFTGITREYITAPQRADSIYQIRQRFPQLVDYHSPADSPGVVYMSIRKTAPGQAFEIAESTAKYNVFGRVVIVVDDDIDVLDSNAVRFAMGSRWQPSLATKMFEDCRAFALDPSSPDRSTTSKVIIDATRQWPEEGGPPFYQELNRTVFEREAPHAIDRVSRKWPDLL